MKILIASLMLIFCLSAQALTVTINGNTVEVDDYTIDETRSGVILNYTLRQDDPTPTPVTTTCRQTYTQTCGDYIDWTDFGPQITVGLRGTDEVISWPLRTTSDPSYRGYTTFSETTQQGGVSRKVWFSTIPNGPAVSSGCSSSGSSTRTIWWAQGRVRGYPCRLEPETQYFLNVTNTWGCPSNRTCTFYRNFGS